MARKEFREAAAAFQQLVNKSPRNAVYLNKLGIAYHQMGEVGQALKCYKRAVKANPSYADAHNNIGTVWYQRKKYGKAIKAYKKAIAVRPEMAVLLMSGYASELRDAEAAAPGARNFLRKPFSREDLAAAIADVLPH